VARTELELEIRRSLVGELELFPASGAEVQRRIKQRLANGEVDHLMSLGLDLCCMCVLTQLNRAFSKKYFYINSSPRDM
jgi:hypothetical protein